MEVVTDGDKFHHTLGDESDVPSRPHPRSRDMPQAGELEWRRPDPDPDEACLLDHPSYRPPKVSPSPASASPHVGRTALLQLSDLYQSSQIEYRGGLLSAAICFLQLRVDGVSCLVPHPWSQPMVVGWLLDDASCHLCGSCWDAAADRRQGGRAELRLWVVMPLVPRRSDYVTLTLGPNLMLSSRKSPQ